MKTRNILTRKFWAFCCLIICAVENLNAEDQVFLTGTTTHFAQLKGIPAENLSLIRQAGFNSIRDEAYWNEIFPSCEKVKGKLEIPEIITSYVNSANAEGLQPLIVLSYANKHYDQGNYPRSAEAAEAFACYAERLVSAFKGKCKYYQVWNEWDGGCGMPKKYHKTGDAPSYINLLKIVYPRIKATDPSATVIANSPCSDEFLKAKLELGLMKYCDAVSHHTYNFGLGADEGTPEKWRDRMMRIDTMLRGFNNGKEVPLFVTEMGWPNYISKTGNSKRKQRNIWRGCICLPGLCHI